VSAVSTIGLVLISGVIAVVAVIGLADGLVHFLCWSAKSLRSPDATDAFPMRVERHPDQERL
jgi:hypothetical protein